MCYSNLLKEGLNQLNRGEYFAAHETLEDLWRESQPADKKALQGLVQVAVAFHHYSTGNLQGANSVLARALANLREGSKEESDGKNEKLGIDDDCAASLQAWLQALQNGSPPPPAPRFRKL
jgi:predicted metal-dependent hydrolase